MRFAATSLVVSAFALSLFSARAFAIDERIADPQAMVPANRMPYAGMTSANDRADLIAYLVKATK